MKKIMIAAVLMSTVLMVGCESEKRNPTTKMLQAQKAMEAAEAINFTENAEIDNIAARLKLTSDPGLTGFALLMNEAGQPIMYTGVAGKITSGGKRLTAPHRVNKHGSAAAGYAYVDTATPSDEGTWGSSNPYVYFWTTGGQYIQWNGKYLYSDKPFRTKVEPLVINITKE